MLASLSWSDPADSFGFEVEVLLMHGDADVFSSASFRFALEEEPALSDCLRLLRRFASEDLFLTSETLADRLAEALDLDPEWALSILLPVHLRNACYSDDIPAEPVALRISRSDARGRAKALFPNPASGEALPYLPLSAIDPSYLKDWA